MEKNINENQELYIFYKPIDENYKSTFTRIKQLLSNRIPT